MRCKLTGEEGQGVNAHVIPRAFYRIEPAEKRSMKIMGTESNQHPRRSQIGEYDDGIVTERGERIFSPLDDYAAELLLERRGEFTTHEHNGVPVALEIQEYDYTALKLFVLSVLWRAAVSSRPFFSKISLGPHEKPIREAILNGDAGDSDWYAVSLASWHDTDARGSILDPHKNRFDGINYYQLYLENYIAYVKVDQRLGAADIRHIQLTPDRPLWIVAREFEGSKELKIMKKAVHTHARANSGDRPRRQPR